jgi:hypothetical protein
MADQKSWKLDFDNVENLQHKNKLDPPGYDGGMAKEWVSDGWISCCSA